MAGWGRGRAVPLAADYRDWPPRSPLHYTGQGPGQASSSSPLPPAPELSRPEPVAQREGVAAQRGGSEGISFLESCETSPAAAKGSCWDKKHCQNTQLGRIRDKQSRKAQQEMSCPAPTQPRF